MTIELGGNITLAGFKELEPGKLIVIKKVVGNYAKKLADAHPGKVTRLTITLKSIHANPENKDNQKHELNARAEVDGKIYHSDIVDFNLFFAIDKVLQKALAETAK